MGPMVALVGFVLFVLFPVCLVLFNPRFSRSEKLVGVAVSALFSWAGLLAFYLLNALAPRPAATPPGGS